MSSSNKNVTDVNASLDETSLMENSQVQDSSMNPRLQSSRFNDTFAALFADTHRSPTSKISTIPGNSDLQPVSKAVVSSPKDTMIEEEENHRMVSFPPPEQNTEKKYDEGQSLNETVNGQNFCEEAPTEDNLGNSRRSFLSMDVSANRSRSLLDSTVLKPLEASLLNRSCSSQPSFLPGKRQSIEESESMTHFPLPSQECLENEANATALEPDETLDTAMLESSQQAPEMQECSDKSRSMLDSTVLKLLGTSTLNDSRSSHPTLGSAKQESADDSEVLTHFPPPEERMENEANTTALEPDLTLNTAMLDSSQLCPQQHEDAEESKEVSPIRSRRISAHNGEETNPDTVLEASSEERLNFKIQLGDAQMQILSLNTELEILKKQLEHATMEKKDYIFLYEDSKRKALEADEKAKLAYAEKAEAEITVAIYKGKLDDMAKTISDDQSKIAQLMIDAEVSRKEHIDEVLRLQEYCASLRETNSEIQDQLTTTQSDKEKLCKEVEELTTEKASLNAIIEELNAPKTAFDVSVIPGDPSLEIAAASTTEIKALDLSHADLKPFENEISKLNEDLNSARNTIEKLERERNESLKSVEDLRQQLAETKYAQKYEAESEQNQLKNDILKANVDKEFLENKIKELNREVAELKHQLTADELIHRKESGRLKDDLLKTKEDIRRLETENIAFKLSDCNIRKQMAEVSAKNETYEIQLDNLKEELVYMRRELDLVTKDRDIVKAKLEMTKSVKTLAQEVTTLAETVNNKLNQKTQTSCTIAEKMESTSDDLVPNTSAKASAALDNELRELREIKKHHEQEIKRCYKLLDDADNAEEEQRDEISRLKREIKKLKEGGSKSKPTTPKAPSEPLLAALRPATSSQFHQNIASSPKPTVRSESKNAEEKVEKSDSEDEQENKADQTLRNDSSFYKNISSTPKRRFIDGQKCEQQ